MAIDFGNGSGTTVNTQDTTVNTNDIFGQNLPTVVESTAVAESNMKSQASIFEQQIRESGVVDRLTSQIKVQQTETITTFGKDAVDELSKVSDAVLKKYDATIIQKTSNMMTDLTNIMKEINLDEILDDSVEENKSFLSKMFSKGKMSLNALLSKYDTVGKKLERVCIELRTYENQIKTSNADIDKMYNANMEYYKRLIAYIMAGEDAIVQVNNYLASLVQKQHETGDPSLDLEIQSVTNAKNLLEQRVQDLRLANTVALQSLPRLKSMEFTNWNLARKINTSFIITLPLFKDAVAQAMIMKQQKLQTESLKSLDDMTNELLLKNSKAAVANMKMSAQLSGSSAIKMETIEKSWETLTQGIADTQQLIKEINTQRALDKDKLAQLNDHYMSSLRPSDVLR
jgi:uncharacterized protein YaaN involved in tellurite resistance